MSKYIEKSSKTNVRNWLIGEKMSLTSVKKRKIRHKLLRKWHKFFKKSEKLVKELLKVLKECKKLVK